MGTTKADKPWHVDLSRFRVYLQTKYAVDQAYYFLGFTQDNRQDLYDSIQKAGFILHFREHSSAMLGKKKGNVDTDVVFLIMKMLYRHEILEKIVRMLVDFLIEEDRFKKILFPDQKRASSLYKKINLKYRADLSAEAVRRKIGHKRKGLLR